MIGARVAMSITAEDVQQGDVITSVEKEPCQAAVTGRPQRDGMWLLVPTSSREMPLAVATRVTVARRTSGNAR